ncbi:MAG: type IV toxin-antitoxin system AbiEi family antitoxin domain-containing protein [Actinobacteria bacterium]|nr:type IV toxin-antitoxin system AbiEi family antitoxin domain-containing protein [Actinomycetota bacterium]
MELATAQHGVVSTRQLKALGYGRNSAAKAARVGRLHRIHRGVYAVGHTDLTWRGECMGAALACAPAVISHWTAGWLWGLFQSSSTLHLTVPTVRRSRRPFLLHLATLADEDVTKVGRIPLTSLARTVLDLAPLVDDERLAGLLERAEKLEDDSGRRLFDLRDFEGLLARTKGHPGHARLAKALRIYRPDAALTRSNLERHFRTLVRRAGLPAPATNYVVGPYEIDAYWERERFGVELDVFATHGSRRSFERDRERADDLLAIGVEIIRVTDVRLAREPAAVMRRLDAHLERRRRTPTFN